MREACGSTHSETSVPSGPTTASTPISSRAPSTHEYRGVVRLVSLVRLCRFSFVLLGEATGLLGSRGRAVLVGTAAVRRSTSEPLVCDRMGVSPGHAAYPAH